MRSGLPDGLPDGLSSLVLPQHFLMLVIVRWGVPRFRMGTWYGTSLVYMVWYIVGVYGMVHRWCIGYGTSLVYMVWYIVGLYGTVHCWFLSKA